MNAAEQLALGTAPRIRVVGSGTDAPLQIAMNPFGAGTNGTRMGRPL